MIRSTWSNSVKTFLECFPKTIRFITFVTFLLEYIRLRDERENLAYETHYMIRFVVSHLCRVSGPVFARAYQGRVAVN